MRLATGIPAANYKGIMEEERISSRGESRLAIDAPAGVSYFSVFPSM